MDDSAMKRNYPTRDDALKDAIKIAHHEECIIIMYKPNDGGGRWYLSYYADPTDHGFAMEEEVISRRFVLPRGEVLKLS